MELEARESMVAACQRLYQRNCLAAGDGNVSLRLQDERILFTPSGAAKAFIEPEQIAVMDLEGHTLAGKPSAEHLMHLTIYRSCPKAQAIVHAHPPHAIAWSVSQPKLSELPGDVLSEVILAAGRIPIVPYATPTTAAMGDHLRPFLPECRALILERHGAVAWGETLAEAVGGMERIEHAAQILWLARSLGPWRPLPPEEIQQLHKMREKIGPRLL